MLPMALPPEFSKQINPDGGFLNLVTYWRANPADPDPNRPGQKLSALLYLPVKPGESCLCGSGKAYRDCCRLKAEWIPVCPDPGGQGHNLIAPQAVTFEKVDGPALRQRLTADLRLLCVDDDPQDSFWIFFGATPVKDQYGAICFGDIELKADQSLLVTAMNDIRMKLLLDTLKEIMGEMPVTPPVQYQPVQYFDKRTRKLLARAPKVRR